MFHAYEPVRFQSVDQNFAICVSGIHPPVQLPDLSSAQILLGFPITPPLAKEAVFGIYIHRSYVPLDEVSPDPKSAIGPGRRAFLC
jgi:hypothetical protein